jgi:hypothetical protein
MVYIVLLELVVLYLVSRKVRQQIGGSLYRLTKSKKWSIYLFAIIFLPGIFIHEASHFLAALFLFVPVGQFELMPEFIDGKLKLGSVPVAKTDFIRRFIIGIAPVIAGLAILFIALNLLSIHRCIDSFCLDGFWGYLVFGYLVFEVANTMFSSKKDLEGAWTFFLVLVLGFVIVWFFGIRIGLDPESLILQRAIDIAKSMSIFLLIPIIIDGFVVLVSPRRKYN